MKPKLTVLLFCLVCEFLPAHEDPHDVIHALTHKLEHAGKAEKAALYFKRSTEYRASRQDEKAKQDLLAYTKLKPADHLGWLELSKLEKDNENRLQYLSKSLKLATDYYDKALSHLALAKHFYITGDFKSSLASCEEAIRLEKNGIVPVELKSHLLWSKDRLDERVKFLTKAREKNVSIVIENMWIEAMIDAGNGDQLKGLIEKNMQESRFKSSWQIRAALCAPQHSDEAKSLAKSAISEINKRLDLERPDITLLMDLARAHAITQDYDRAQHYFKLVKSSPHDPWTISELEKRIKETELSSK